jgi:uncharacterized surface protein with fasciclin (FAS1) repeats
MEAARNNPTGPARNIVDTAISAGNFSVFAAAIEAAGLTEALAAKGPFTVIHAIDAVILPKHWQLTAAAA